MYLSKGKVTRPLEGLNTKICDSSSTNVWHGALVDVLLYISARTDTTNPLRDFLKGVLVHEAKNKLL